MAILHETIEETLIDLAKTNKPQNCEDLANLAESKLPVNRSTILKTILRLEKEGRINLQNKNPTQPTTLKSSEYLKSAYSYWIVLGLTIITVILVSGILNFALLDYARYFLGSVFVLGLPGYSLSKALWPNKFTRHGTYNGIDWPLRIAFSIVLSIALVSVIGLFLDYTPLGVHLNTLVASLSFLTIFLATVGLIREYKNQK